MSRKNHNAAVIFDCDGVMFDSRDANINFYNHLLDHFGLPPMKEDDIAYVHMHTADSSVRHIFRGTAFLEEALRYRFDVDYTPFIRDMILEPGLKELLTRLRPCYMLAVATNRSNTIVPVLEAHELTGFFDAVVSSLDVARPKPDPECLFKITGLFGISPEKAIYVGDSEIDYVCSRAAGVPFVSFRNRVLDADYHVDKLLDILKIPGSFIEDSRCGTVS
jgi:phosphoglycolate phosphatase-like HAD superfamily hydrolase